MYIKHVPTPPPTHTHLARKSRNPGMQRDKKKERYSARLLLYFNTQFANLRILARSKILHFASGAGPDSVRNFNLSF